MAHLTKEQRYVISALRKRGVLQKEIAKELGVSPGTICRELKRNSGKRGGYNAQSAHSLSEERKERYTLKQEMIKSTTEKNLDIGKETLLRGKTTKGLP